METVRHNLMLRESRKRINSAEALQATGDDSDSAYLLRLIGFELLLKIVVEQSTGEEVHGHVYQDLFDLLPAQLQTTIVRSAGERIGPSALTSDHTGVLADLGSNFVKLRYSYEKHSHMTEHEYAEVGDA